MPPRVGGGGVDVVEGGSSPRVRGLRFHEEILYTLYTLYRFIPTCDLRSSGLLSSGLQGDA
jgi:hypothetical protein